MSGFPSINTSVVVFAGAGGIGTAVCQALAGTGASVLATSREQRRLDALLGSAEVASRIADPTQPADAQATIEDAKQRFGKVNAVVNLAGSFLLKPAHLTTDDEFAQQIAANLTSSFIVLRAAAAAMMDTGGSIVLMSSVAGTIGLANHEAIAAAKAGVDGLVRSAAATYAPRGIRVNAVAPGLTQTPMTERLTSNQASLKASVAMHPLGRIGRPEDIAAAITWLISGSSDWITGQVVGVDGGLSRVRSR